MLMMIHNQSPHQGLVGRILRTDGCSAVCIAAHEDAILILQHSEDAQPANYVVCHSPEVNHGKLVWGSGDYFTIPSYQLCGHANPMADALADAMNALISSTALEFRFDPIGDASDNLSVYVLIHGTPDPVELASIESSAASYLKVVNAYGFEEMVHEVMKEHPALSFRILEPNHIFHV